MWEKDFLTFPQPIFNFLTFWMCGIGCNEFPHTFPHTRPSRKIKRKIPYIFPMCGTLFSLHQFHTCGKFLTFSSLFPHISSHWIFIVICQHGCRTMGDSWWESEKICFQILFMPTRIKKPKTDASDVIWHLRRYEWEILFVLGGSDCVLRKALLFPYSGSVEPAFNDDTCCYPDNCCYHDNCCWQGKWSNNKCHDHETTGTCYHHETKTTCYNNKTTTICYHYGTTAIWYYLSDAKSNGIDSCCRHDYRCCRVSCCLWSGRAVTGKDLLHLFSFKRQQLSSTVNDHWPGHFTPSLHNSSRRSLRLSYFLVGSQISIYISDIDLHFRYRSTFP